LIDMASIMTCLEKAIQTDYSVVADMYAGNLPSDLRPMDLPAYLYGSFSGIAVTLFNLVPALTSTFGISALPAVTAAWVGGNKTHIKRNIESVMRITSIVAFPAGFGIAMMAQPIAEFVFYKVPQEAAIGGDLLQILGIAAIFVALATPINSILQAMGRVDIPVKLLVLGGAVKLAANYMLIQIPSVNIQAAPYGTLLCYMIIITISMIVLTRTIQSQLRWGSVFIKPLTAAVLCGITARVSYDLISRASDSLFIVIFAIVLGGIIYAISLILLRGICKEDVLMLPMGEKVAKLLEKHHLLG
ncbi:MAG: polysaccharide biosynthesis C-terminal domain-containing protein, partial [Oscillospiraceae bacterium]